MMMGPCSANSETARRIGYSTKVRRGVLASHRLSVGGRSSEFSFAIACRPHLRAILRVAHAGYSRGGQERKARQRVARFGDGPPGRIAGRLRALRTGLRALDRQSVTRL